MAVEPGLFYMKSHEWVKIEDGEAVFGISDFAQDQLGDVTFVELPAIGEKLVPGQELGSIESVKAASELYSPAAGEVIAVNDELETAPEKVNREPYGGGWLIRVKLDKEPDGLMNAGEYEKYISGLQ